MSRMRKTIPQSIPTTGTSEIYICIQKETEEIEEAEEEPGKEEPPKQKEQETRYMPLQDKESNQETETSDEATGK